MTLEPKARLNSPSGVQNRSQHVTVWGLVASLTVYFIYVIILRFFSIDDAYISFRFAKHLAEGLGLTWNPGYPPVEGYSNFLWVLYLAGAKALSLPIELTAKVTGAVFGGVTLILLWITAKRLWPENKFTWVPSLLVAFCPVWTMWAVSGLELAAHAFLLMVLVMSLTFNPPQRTMLSSLALSLLIVSRPEGLILAGAFLLTVFFFASAGPFTARLKQTLIPIAASLMTVAGLMTFRLSYYGYPFANTVYSKFSAELPSVSQVADWIWFGLPFFIAYIIAFRRQMATSVRTILLVGFVLVITQMIIVLPVVPVMYFLHRYQIFMLPVLVLAIPPVIASLSHKRRWFGAAIIVGLCLWAAQQWPNVTYRYEAESHYRHQHKLVVDYLQQLPGKPTIAMLDAGRMPYWSGLPAIDAWGLCDATIARQEYHPRLVFETDLGIPDVYILTIYARGFDLLPRLGGDKMMSANPYFQENYELWRVCSGRKFYGYALMLHTDFIKQHNIPAFAEDEAAVSPQR